MSSYSPERFQEPFGPGARPFKLALLERSLALSRIVRRGWLAALESEPCAETDQDDSGELSHDGADARAQAAPAQPAHNVAVGDEPDEQHDLEGGDHEGQPDRRVAGKSELGHDGHEEGARLGVEEVAHQALAPCAQMAGSPLTAGARCAWAQLPTSWGAQQTSRTEIEKIGGARQLENGERRRRAVPQDGASQRRGRGPGEDADGDA